MIGCIASIWIASMIIYQEGGLGKLTKKMLASYLPRFVQTDKKGNCINVTKLLPQLFPYGLSLSKPEPKALWDVLLLCGYPGNE